MAHNLDFSKGSAAFVSFAAPAWHNLGKVVNTALNAEQALQMGGLDFQVLKLPNVHMIPNGGEFNEVISEDSFFTLRTDVNKVLGSRLGRDYTVLQNAEAFNVVDEILQTGSASIETAGAIDEGRKVFICLKANDQILVNGKDSVNQYILICNSHDGSMAIQAMFTNIRVVCNNTLTAALGQAQDKIKIRHTSTASFRLQEAMKVMKLIKENTQINAENYGKMAEMIISKEQMFDYFGNVFMSAEEIKDLQKGNKASEVLSTRKSNILAEVVNFANSGTGQRDTLLNGQPTMWTAYNAVTGYVTRKKYSSADDRANSMLFGSAAATIHDAGVLALEPAKIKPLHNTNRLNGFNLN